MAFPEARLNERDFSRSLAVTVRAVSRALLAVAGQPVANDLVRHTAVADDADREGLVLDDRFVPRCDHFTDKSRCAVRRDLALGLVARPAGAFDVAEDLSAVD